MVTSKRIECEEVHFDSWRSFKAGFEDHLSRATDRIEQPYPFLFRGQGDAGWPLVTKFARDICRLPGPSKNPRLSARARRKALLELFQSELKLSDVAQLQPKASPWALGQHYGLPSPLLDWSSSAYVAAFFAAESAAEKIHAENRRELETLKQRFAIFAIRQRCGAHWERMKVDFISDTEPLNRRIRPQLGYFTITNSSDEPLEQIIGSYCAKHRGLSMEDFLVKFTLPYSAALAALRDLESMDITPRRIYADLTGVCRAATQRLRLQALGVEP